MLAKLTEGVWLSDGKVRAKRARIVGRQGQATMLELVLAEGKKREIRRMLSKLGHKVMSLNRIAVGPISLKGLSVGECRSLSKHEIELLRKVASGESVPPPRFFDGRLVRVARHGESRGRTQDQASPVQRVTTTTRHPARIRVNNDRWTAAAPPSSQAAAKTRPRSGPRRPQNSASRHLGLGLNSDRPARRGSCDVENARPSYVRQTPNRTTKPNAVAASQALDARCHRNRSNHGAASSVWSQIPSRGPGRARRRAKPKAAAGRKRRPPGPCSVKRTELPSRDDHGE